MRIYIELTTKNNLISALIHEGNRATGYTIQNLRLGRTDFITIRGEALQLDDLITTLIDYRSDSMDRFFDERGQLLVGQYLYAQTIGQLSPQFQRQLLERQSVDVRIITTDEHLARLPWPLLAERNVFLCAKSWSVSLAADSVVVDHALPPSPRILIIAPQPADTAKTDADPHLENLSEMLLRSDPLLAFGKNLRRVGTWSELIEALEAFNPHIVYYYGHGSGGEARSRLLFADKNNKKDERSIADFSLCLRNMEVPPIIVYANCCSGDAAGLLGIGQQLSDFVPVVLTNRTLATIQAAKAQAMKFWKSVLIKGHAPHVATAQLYSRLTEINLSVTDVRWLTPVLHCNYDKWHANPPLPVDRQFHDPHWDVKIDRVTQYSVVAEQTRQMLREQKPKSHVFIWYGQKGEGIEIFHQRLNVELRESLSRTHLYLVRPEWPVEFESLSRSLNDMFLETFGIARLSDVTGRVREETRGATGTQTLIYVRHTPIPQEKKVLTIARLKGYLEWWDSVLVPELGAKQHALLGISFEVKNPAKFLNAVDSIQDMNLQNTVVRVLDQMERLALNDLRDFLRTHNIRGATTELRDKALNKILERTDGAYESTIEALKDVQEALWLEEREMSRSLDSTDEDDW